MLRSRHCRARGSSLIDLAEMTKDMATLPSPAFLAVSLNLLVCNEEGSVTLTRLYKQHK